MVDRVRRDKCAAIIEAFVAGHTTNYVYDRAMQEVADEDRDGPDAAPWQVYHYLWHAYCDMREQIIDDLDPEAMEAFRRCASFLRSDIDLPAGRRKDWGPGFPFATRAAYAAFQEHERCDLDGARPGVDHAARDRLATLIEDFMSGYVPTTREFPHVYSASMGPYSLSEPGVGALYGWLCSATQRSFRCRPYARLPSEQRGMFERTLLFLRADAPVEWQAVAYEKLPKSERMLLWTPLGCLASVALGLASLGIGWLLGAPGVGLVIGLLLGGSFVAGWAFQYFELRPRPHPGLPQDDRWAVFPFTTRAAYKEALALQESGDEEPATPNEP